MTGTPIAEKDPKNVPKFPNAKDGYVCLAEVPKIELLDLLEREKKLLGNKKFIEKLPDRGKKIADLYLRVKEELRKREEHENLCGLIASLNVTDSKNTVDQIEWTGKCDTESNAEPDGDTETNPLQILATHSGTDASKQINITKQPIETALPLEKPEVDVYAQQLCDRFDVAKLQAVEKRFYPHKSLNKTSIKEIIRDKEPVISSVHSTNSPSMTKMLTLQESIVIQQDQTKKLKEIELRHAIEKLQEKPSIRIGNPVSETSMYREQIVDSEEESDSVGTHPESDEDDDRDTAIFYNLVDDHTEDR